jgi:hypothetical protein
MRRQHSQWPDDDVKNISDARGWTAQTAAAGLNQLSKRLAWGSFSSMDSNVTVEFSSLMCALQEGGKDVYTETQKTGH